MDQVIKSNIDRILNLEIFLREGQRRDRHHKQQKAEENRKAKVILNFYALNREQRAVYMNKMRSTLRRKVEKSHTNPYAVNNSEGNGRKLNIILDNYWDIKKLYMTLS